MESFVAKEKKIVVVGLDGATFDIIKPLINRGKLPNLARIMQNGVYGKLRSTIHPITPQAWTSFLTGKNAGKHGILDFTSRKKGSYGIQFINASHRKAETIFSILSKAQKRVGAIAIPFTFPPEKVNGFMLSGIDSPAGDKRSVYPVSVYEEIKEKFGNYYIHLASPVGRKIDQKKFWNDIKVEDENRTRISTYLMEKYPCDFFMTVYNNTDRVAHQHLDAAVLEMIQCRKKINDDDLLVKTYVNCDAQLGVLLSKADRNTSVIVMSDHGSGPIRRVFFLNRWLEENSLLKYSEKKNNSLHGAFHQGRFLAKRFLPRSAKNFIKSKMAGVRDKIDSTLSFSGIDWKQTKAYGFGMYGNIYINLKGREPEGIVEPGNEFEDICGQIVEKLSVLKDPDTGEQIVEKVYMNKELFHGPCFEDAPDLLINWKDYAYYTSVTLGKEEGSIFGSHMNIDCSDYKHVGTHRLNGIFMAMGKTIRRGVKISNAKIIDVAPTILYMLGQPIPEDMDGEILTEIFEENFVKMNSPKYSRFGNKYIEGDIVSYSEEENREVAERLRGLGYLE